MSSGAQGPVGENIGIDRDDIQEGRLKRDENPTNGCWKDSPKKSVYTKTSLHFIQNI